MFTSFWGPLWNVKDLGVLRICNVGIITYFVVVRATLT